MTIWPMLVLKLALAVQVNQIEAELKWVIMVITSHNQPLSQPFESSASHLNLQPAIIQKVIGSQVYFLEMSSYHTIIRSDIQPYHPPI